MTTIATANGNEGMIVTLQGKDVKKRRTAPSCLPMALSASTPTHVPDANAVAPTNRTTPYSPVFTTFTTSPKSKSDDGRWSAVAVDVAAVAAVAAAAAAVADVDAAVDLRAGLPVNAAGVAVVAVTVVLALLSAGRVVPVVASFFGFVTDSRRFVLPPTGQQKQWVSKKCTSNKQWAVNKGGRFTFFSVLYNN